MCPAAAVQILLAALPVARNGHMPAAFSAPCCAEEHNIEERHPRQSPSAAALASPPSGVPSRCMASLQAGRPSCCCWHSWHSLASQYAPANQPHQTQQPQHAQQHPTHSPENLAVGPTPDPDRQQQQEEYAAQDLRWVQDAEDEAHQATAAPPHGEQRVQDLQSGRTDRSGGVVRAACRSHQRKNHRMTHRNMEDDVGKSQACTAQAAQSGSTKAVVHSGHQQRNPSSPGGEQCSNAC